MAATAMSEVSEPPLHNSTQIDDIYFNMGNENQEEFEIKQSELEQLKVALKNKTFRQMLSNYVDEVRDPENQMTYQSEVCQLEKERGNIVHFVNPKGCYVLKTSVDGDKKAFINICSNPLIRKPTTEEGIQDNTVGTFWSIPYTQSQGREDYDKSGNKCFVYDVIFNPEALQLAKQNASLQKTLEQTAIEAVEKSFKVSLDKVNIRRPKLKYKGMRHAATIKYKIGEQPPHIVDLAQIGKEQPPEKDGAPGAQAHQQTSEKPKRSRSKKKSKSKACDATIEEPATSGGELSYAQWTHPKYTIKYRSHIDLQNFCTDVQRQDIDANVPDQLVLTTNLPLLKNSVNLDADVVDDGEGFELKSNQEALYYLKVKLPYKVHPDSAKATFDKDKRQLTICMDIKKNKVTKPIQITLQELSLQETDDDRFPNEMLFEKETGSSTELPPVIEDPFEEGNGDCFPDGSSSSLIGSPTEKKTVRFSDDVKRQIYRSNSSILGQRKKNQRKTQSRRRRLNSVDSISSVDEDEDSTGVKVRQRSFSGGSVSSLDEDDFSKYGTSY